MGVDELLQRGKSLVPDALILRGPIRGPYPAGDGFEQVLLVQWQSARSVAGALGVNPCPDAASFPGDAFDWLRVAGLGDEGEEGFVVAVPLLLSAAVMGHRCDVGAALRGRPSLSRRALPGEAAAHRVVLLGLCRRCSAAVVMGVA